MVWSAGVDVFPCFGVGVREFVWCNAHNRSVPCVESLELLVQLPTVGRHYVGKAERSPKKRAWIVPERMQIRVVESSEEEKLGQ